MTFSGIKEQSGKVACNKGITSAYEFANENLIYVN